MGRDWRETSPWTEAELPGVCVLGIRTREGLTQKQLAARTGLSVGRLSQMENHKREITPEEAQQLAQAMNAEAWLFYGRLPRNKKSKKDSVT